MNKEHTLTLTLPKSIIMFNQKSLSEGLQTFLPGKWNPKNLVAGFKANTKGRTYVFAVDLYKRSSTEAELVLTNLFGV